MPTNEEYETAIKKQHWPELRQLWERIKAARHARLAAGEGV